jgi:hypothetical protein
MYPFQDGEREQDLVLHVKKFACLQATGVVSKQFAAEKVLQVELGDQRVY